MPGQRGIGKQTRLFMRNYCFKFDYCRNIPLNRNRRLLFSPNEILRSAVKFRSPPPIVSFVHRILTADRRRSALPAACLSTGVAACTAVQRCRCLRSPLCRSPLNGRCLSAARPTKPATTAAADIDRVRDDLF